MQIKGVELELGQSIEECTADPRINLALPAGADAGIAAHRIAQRRFQSIRCQPAGAWAGIGDAIAIFQTGHPSLVTDGSRDKRAARRPAFERLVDIEGMGIALPP